MVMPWMSMAKPILGRSETTKCKCLYFSSTFMSRCQWSERQFLREALFFRILCQKKFGGHPNPTLPRTSLYSLISRTETPLTDPISGFHFSEERNALISLVINFLDRSPVCPECDLSASQTSLCRSHFAQARNSEDSSSYLASGLSARGWMKSLALSTSLHVYLT